MKTRNSLLTSVIALVFCVAILAGTTFAWFSDMVASKNNVIQAGNLEISMEWANDFDATTWKDVSSGAIFTHNNWEPGYTDVKYIKITNKGSLNLKWRLTLEAEGTVTKLSDVIGVYYANPAKAQLTSIDGLTAAGTLTNVLNNRSVFAPTGALVPGEEVIVAIAMHMSETADNEYQTMSLCDEGFLVKLVATQDVGESDSFGDDYDNDAEWPDFQMNFEASESLEGIIVRGELATDVVIRHESGAYAIVPKGTKLAEGATELKFTGKNADANGNFADPSRSYDIHIEGIADDNTTCITVFVGKILEPGLSETELKLYHEDAQMSRVESVSDFANNNQYTYDAQTGAVVLYVDNFSVFSAVQATVSKWEDGTEADTSWYNEDGTEFTLADVADFLGFRDLVDGGNTFEGKTVTLGVDIDLSDKPFDPIGFGYYKNDKRTETEGVVTDTNTVFMGTFDGGNHTIYNLYQNGWELDPDKTNYGTYTYSTAGGGLFASIKNATIKNLAISGAEIVFECVDMGIVVGYAQGECHFENIVVANSNIANYNRYTGGVVGEVSYGTDNNGDSFTHTFKNITVDSTVTVSGLWGSFGCGMGGVIGGKWGDATVKMENVVSAPVMDVYNDVVSAYQWYAFRGCGMLIGHTEEPYSDGRHSGIATASFLTCENVKVYYGDWVNYTYYQFAEQTDAEGNVLWYSNYPWVRAEAGEYCDAFSNIRYGIPVVNGVKVTELSAEDFAAAVTSSTPIIFNQLYGADRGMYGQAAHAGVTVIDKNTKTIYIENDLGWTNLKLHYWYQNGEDTWTNLDENGIALTEENGVYRVDLPAYAHAFSITADGGEETKEVIISDLTEGSTHKLTEFITCLTIDEVLQEGLSHNKNEHSDEYYYVKLTLNNQVNTNGFARAKISDTEYISVAGGYLTGEAEGSIQLCDIVIFKAQIGAVNSDMVVEDGKEVRLFDVKYHAVIGQDHAYGEDVTVDTAPTCGTTGVGHVTCTVVDYSSKIPCGATKEVVIPATGLHTKADNSYLCTECGNSVILTIDQVFAISEQYAAGACSSEYYYVQLTLNNQVNANGFARSQIAEDSYISVEGGYLTEDKYGSIVLGDTVIFKAKIGTVTSALTTSGKETRLYDVAAYEFLYNQFEDSTDERVITLAGGKLTSGTYGKEGETITSVYGMVGEEITLPTPKLSNYNFAGWYLDYACTVPFTETTYGDDNLFLFAKWVSNTSEQITILSYNVSASGWTNDDGPTKQAIKAAGNPDIICLQNAGSAWKTISISGYTASRQNENTERYLIYYKTDKFEIVASSYNTYYSYIVLQRTDGALFTVVNAWFDNSLVTAESTRETQLKEMWARIDGIWKDKNRGLMPMIITGSFSASTTDSNIYQSLTENSLFSDASSVAKSILSTNSADTGDYVFASYHMQYAVESYKVLGVQNGRYPILVNVALPNVCSHIVTKTEAIAATCTTEGRAEYYTCSKCGEIFADVYGTIQTTVEDCVIEPLNHNYEWIVDTHPTLESEGVKHEECIVCQATRNENTPMDKLTCAHNITTVEATAATCKAAGNKEYYSCSVCNKVYSNALGTLETTEEDYTIPALPHTWVDATCITPKTCSVCGATEGTVSTEHALNSEGTCTDCGQNFAVTITLLGGPLPYGTYSGDNAKIADSVSGNDGETITLPTPTLTGHTFGGWYTDYECTNPFTEKTFIKDVNWTLYAKWTPNTESIKVMSFNVRTDWFKGSRDERVVATIQANNPDVLCVQEADQGWMSILNDRLPDLGYTAVYANKWGRDGENSGECTAIFFKTDKFTAVASGTKWLSNTPNAVSKYSYTDADGTIHTSNYPRILTYVVLEHKQGGGSFLVVNTHLDNNGNNAHDVAEIIRQAEVDIMMNIIKGITNARGDLPIIVTGDFNVIPPPSYRTAYDAMVNKYEYSDSSQVATQSDGRKHTYNGMGSGTPSILDYIFVSRHMKDTVAKYTVCDATLNGEYVSDHNAIISIIEMPYVKRTY